MTNDPTTHGLRRGHLADLEVIEAILLTDPRVLATSCAASPREMAEAVRNMIEDTELHNPDSFTASTDQLREGVERLRDEIRACVSDYAHVNVGLPFQANDAATEHTLRVVADKLDALLAAGDTP